MAIKPIGEMTQEEQESYAAMILATNPRPMPEDFDPHFVESEAEIWWEGDPTTDMAALGTSKAGCNETQAEYCRIVLRTAIWNRYEAARLERQTN